MSQEIETLVEFYSEASGKAFMVLKVIAKESNSLGKAEILQRMLTERTRLSTASVYRAVKYLEKIEELTVKVQREKCLPNIFQIEIQNLKAKPCRVSISPLLDNPATVKAVEDYANSTSVPHVNLNGGCGKPHVNLNGGSIQPDMRAHVILNGGSIQDDMRFNEDINNESHARARVPDSIHELNRIELNSEKKFSTGQPPTPVPPEVASFNTRKIESFTPSKHLLEWAANNCPLVPVETATAQWREWVVARMVTKLKNPTAHWREYLRNQQNWREQEANEKAALLVGASPAPLRLESVPDAIPLSAPIPTPAPASIEPEFDAVEAALQAMPVEQITELRAQFAQQMAEQVGDKLLYWDDEAKRRWINVRVRRVIAEQLAAQEAA